jgi:hypothetical protein
MNPYVNEEMMWQRLKDIQLEAENSRLWATHAVPATVRLLQFLGGRVGRLAWLATHRASRRRHLHIVDDRDTVSDVA